MTDYTFTLTAHAKARGWDAAFGAGVVRVKDGQCGRGERSRPSKPETTLYWGPLHPIARDSDV